MNKCSKTNHLLTWKKLDQTVYQKPLLCEGLMLIAIILHDMDCTIDFKDHFFNFAAQLLSLQSIDPSDYTNQLDQFMLDVSAVAVVCALWTGFVLITSGTWKNVPHSQTFLVLISQAFISIGAIFWATLSCTHGWKLYIQYGFFAYGMYASRINTALLSMLLFLCEVYPESRVRYFQKAFAFMGLTAPLVLVVIIASAVQAETGMHGAQKVNPFFQYGETQATVSLILLIASFVVTMVSLILMQRSRRFRETATLRDSSTTLRATDEDRRLLSTTDDDFEERVIDDADNQDVQDVEEVAANHCDGRQCANPRLQQRRYRCDSEHRQYCSSLLERYSAPPATDVVEELEDFHLFDRDHQTTRHVFLLIALLVSMFVGIALCIWMLVMDELSGLFLLLLFVDGFLSLGQGIITFACFGLESQYVFVPILRWCRTLVYGQQLDLPSWEDVDEETKHCCQQFLKHHIAVCMEAIVKDVRVRLTVHKAVFKGSDLVSWLVEVGLASDRQSGVTYGRHLVKGRVIRHIDNYVDFYDDNFIYTFEPVTL